MKRFLKIADTIMYVFAEHVGAIMTFLIFAIVTIMVFVRYVFKTSSMGFEELPTYFLMIAIWLGAVVCSRDPKEGQIKIDMLETILKKHPKARAIANVAIQFFSISCMVLYSYLSWKYTVFNFNAGYTTLLIHVPMWILVGATFLAVVFLTIYEVAILVRNIQFLAGRRDSI